MLLCCFSIVFLSEYAQDRYLNESHSSALLSKTTALTLKAVLRVI